MKKINRAKLLDYQEWINTFKNDGVKLIPFNCPVFLGKLKTPQPPYGETWDSFSNCPYCNSLLFKAVYGENVEAEVIYRIGETSNNENKTIH